MNDRVEMQLANESKAAYADPDSAYFDRQQFVDNLGVLLAQTREGIVQCVLDDNEVVHIYYKNGHEQLVNINMDSYMAIIRDVTKGL